MDRRGVRSILMEGNPMPSDHVPMVIDLDNAGHLLEIEWT